MQTGKRKNLPPWFGLKMLPPPPPPKKWTGPIQISRTTSSLHVVSFYSDYTVNQPWGRWPLSVMCYALTMFTHHQYSMLNKSSHTNWNDHLKLFVRFDIKYIHVQHCRNLSRAIMHTEIFLHHQGKTFQIVSLLIIVTWLKFSVFNHQYFNMLSNLCYWEYFLQGSPFQISRHHSLFEHLLNGVPSFAEFDQRLEGVVDPRLVERETRRIAHQGPYSLEVSLLGEIRRCPIQGSRLHRGVHQLHELQS